MTFPASTTVKKHSKLDFFWPQSANLLTFVFAGLTHKSKWGSPRKYSKQWAANISQSCQGFLRVGPPWRSDNFEENRDQSDSKRQYFKKSLGRIRMTFYNGLLLVFKKPAFIAPLKKLQKCCSLN